ncbi:protein of unknown function UPF0047 [Bacteroides coprosuis DSM 18011]|uniref:Secondary thiamine-phosphate synthase enzyme n=2 Tax=Bacteroides TaxID=816 RepID=F3ZTY6_9BACE|nr:secondary thiamine-phosphate synthase enzyme YjbQ [Bacteroides coprosuis]EGJ72370.1 protein of unknown function UPF0047 [Bacteroides coprosuis DSM 18011]HJD91278.1 secondary thiamine-phosphate synthase enzyme YjbQ [Bacteroides coprosuis]
MIHQREFRLKARSRGFHYITSEVLEQLPSLPDVGMLNLFIKHTSAGLTINENADPSVLDDLNSIFNRLVKDGESYYIHSYEGSDDMSAHAKTVLVGTSLNIPITNGQLNLGTWQGIYLCEFRDYGGPRSLIATVIG